MARVLFVFAHQDDEVATASRIRLAKSRGDEVTCVYLTDGAVKVASHIRDDESRRALAILGVTDARFLGSRERIADGTLVEHLDRALALLESEVAHADEVITLAWEGGHQDHDAAHLIAAVYASKRGIPCREMPLYNGQNTRANVFRVHHPIGEGWESRWVPLREKLATAWLCRFYKSQRRTWLALVPLMLIGARRELIRTADLARALSPPHRGPLLYERRFRYPQERFASFAQPFLQRWRRD